MELTSVACTNTLLHKQKHVGGRDEKTAMTVHSYVKTTTNHTPLTRLVERFGSQRGGAEGRSRTGHHSSST